MSKIKKGSTEKTQVSKPANTAVGAPINYEHDAGAGMEGAERDSFAIPFLLVLQPSSPQIVVKELEGAKAGILCNSVTDELYGETAIIIPCAYQRRWLRWGARNAGGGFKGEFTTSEMAEMREKNQIRELDNRLFFPGADGSINDERDDKLVDTRSHFVLVLRSPKDDLGVPMILALSSTGIKHSKSFMSRIEGIKKPRADGAGYYTPASFSHMYEMNTEKNTNDRGTWWTPNISMVGPVDNANVYKQAKDFGKTILEGKVHAAHESIQEPGSTEGGDKKTGNSADGF